MGSLAEFCEVEGGNDVLAAGSHDFDGSRVRVDVFGVVVEPHDCACQAAVVIVVGVDRGVVRRAGVHNSAVTLLLLSMSGGIRSGVMRLCGFGVLRKNVLKVAPEFLRL